MAIKGSLVDSEHSCRMLVDEWRHGSEWRHISSKCARVTWRSSHTTTQHRYVQFTPPNPTRRRKKVCRVGSGGVNWALVEKKSVSYRRKSTLDQIPTDFWAASHASCIIDAIYCYSCLCVWHARKVLQKRLDRSWCRTSICERIVSAH